MAMQSAVLISPLFPRFVDLLPSRLEVCTLWSRRRKCLPDYRTRPAKDLLLTRSSEDRRQNLDENIGSGEEIKSPARQELDWDLGWLPAFPHVLTSSMANFLFGYHIGVMNGPIEVIAKELGFDGNPFLEGLVVSIFIVGAFIGCISSSSLSEKLGCRRTLQINAIPLIIGALLSAKAHSLDEMLWGRFIVGLGIGVNTVLVPIYISEVSPTRYRGSFGSLCQIGTCLGIIAALSLALPSDNDPNWWRSLFLIASGPGLLLILGMQFAAESPRWLCKVGRLADAESVICNLWGETDVENSMKEIMYVTGNIDDRKPTWLDLLVEPHRKVAFIGGSLFILQQLSGINGVLYFSSLTFSDVGITSGSLASLYVGITNFAGSLMALYLMDKQGRKKLLVGSYLGMAFSMFIVALAIVSPVEEDLSHTLSVVGSLTYIFSFAVGAGPVTGLVIPELSSAQMRSKIMAYSFSIHWSEKKEAHSLFSPRRPSGRFQCPISSTIQRLILTFTIQHLILVLSLFGKLTWTWRPRRAPILALRDPRIPACLLLICNFLVGLFFLDLVEKFGVAWVYGVFGAVSICSAIFAIYFVVETKGRTLEEIEISLASDVQSKGR